MKQFHQVLRTDDESDGQNSTPDNYTPAATSPSDSQMVSNNPSSGRVGSGGGSNSNNNSAFLANECLSYAFSVWRMEGAWNSSQADVSSWALSQALPLSSFKCYRYIFQPLYSVSFFFHDEAAPKENHRYIVSYFVIVFLPMRVYIISCQREFVEKGNKKKKTENKKESSWFVDES